MAKQKVKVNKKKRYIPILSSPKFKKIIKSIGKIFLTGMLVSIITICIVGGVLTVYILNFVDLDAGIDLRNLKLNYTTIVYSQDYATGKPVEAERIFGKENRIWIDSKDIPQSVKDATIAIEDKRFMQHAGVDWKRTTASMLNLFFKFWKTNPGGSTITQQLVKNITTEDDFSVVRKVEEIFRAMNLEGKYSKEEIIEAYLNTVGFGVNCNGIQSAANTYFGKDASELTVAEGAAIVGITQYPVKYNPFTHPDKNKTRQELILTQMYEQGTIKTKDELKAAKAEKLNFKTREVKNVQSYFVDQVIEDVIAGLVKEKGYKKDYAERQVFVGGYKIYTTMDKNVQSIIEEKYKNPATFPKIAGTEQPQSAMVIMDYQGRVIAMAGGRGEKTGDRSLNRATQSKRQPGSTIKPLAVYSPGIEFDKITYSTVIEDSPIQTVIGNKTQMWPTNYYAGYSGNMTVDTAIQRSCNTVAVKVCKMLDPVFSFNFLTSRLGITSLVKSVKINGEVKTDTTLGPMALGGLTYGVSPLEWAGAYQIFGNGGKYTKPYTYTKVVDSFGNIILENNPRPTQAISPETATVMNRLLQRVTKGPMGTGRGAVWSDMPIAGKTGTSSEDYDQWFVGMTPYYVGVLWFGYDTPKKIKYSAYPPPVAWKNVMSAVHKGLPTKDFTYNENVLTLPYCTVTGKLAGANCPAETGYYKPSNVPGKCTLHG